jgi:uncharacterized protein YlxW (UPF0749 family)
MTPLHPHPIYFSRSGPDLADDVEMLQTDVMRFFAILCLCLTAIFALVKALPIAPPAAAPTIVEPADLEAEAESLQKKVAALKENLNEMQTRVTAARADAERASSVAVKAARTEQTVLARVVTAREALEKVSQTLGDTRREIEVRESKLVKIADDIAGKRRLQGELQNKIENETRTLAEIRAKIGRMQATLDRKVPADQSILKKPPEKEVAPEPEQKGFTLRFASDEALETLIAGGNVKFYAFAGKKAWRLTLSGGKPVYSETESPRQIYEMETLTVPADYVSVFRRQIAVFGRDTTTWGVTLPTRTTASINSLVKGRKGGDLVITAAGEVDLN